MKRILSLDGGGGKGLTIAQYLTRHPNLYEDADMIAGTSTGGLIALALAHGLSASEIVRWYEERLPHIFRKRFPRYLWVLTRERYSAKPLERALREVFGDASLRSLKKQVLVTSADQRAPRRQDALYLWDNRNPFRIFDAARATSAAPTYFPPHIKGNRAFVDGGLIANNPALVALTEWGKTRGDEPVEVWSIGAGLEPNATHGVPRAPWRWVDDVIALGIQGNVGAVDTMLRNVAKGLGPSKLRYHRVDFVLDRAIAMDDARPEALAYLRSRARKEYVMIDGDRVA